MAAGYEDDAKGAIAHALMLIEDEQASEILDESIIDGIRVLASDLNVDLEYLELNDQENAEHELDRSYSNANARFKV